MIHEIEISPAKRGAGAMRYEVRHNGELLIARSRDPEFEAARILIDQGRTGTLATRWSGSETVSMRMPLTKAAKLTTTESDKGQSRIVNWKPHDWRKHDAQEAA